MNGFPLDDAWIHQTYARNLAQTGKWTYFSGELSGGSTSPLWGGLLSIGFLFHLGPYIWTFFLEWLILLGIGFVGIKIFNSLLPNENPASLILGILMVSEWHLVWSAGSGMETLFFSLITTLVFYLLVTKPQQIQLWFLIGLLIGISVWLRPDGITLVGPAALIAILTKPKKEIWRLFIALLLGFTIFFSFYLFFSQLVTGSWWPNSFYAKQAEYAEVTKISIIIRFFQQLIQPLIGVGAVLVPGFIYINWVWIKDNRYDLLTVPLWVLGYLFLYAWRLPVIYQHGRYAIPVMPIYFMMGFIGSIHWFRNTKKKKIKFVIKWTWFGSIAVVMVAFWLLGLNAYRNDVKIINSEMVAAAKWLNQNTTKEDIIAVHDIGAIGYFCDRKIIDLAGLISPDVISIIRDEEKLSNYLDLKKVDFLVIFPDWYPMLVNRSKIVFNTQAEISTTFGRENLSIYKWSPP